MEVEEISKEPVTDMTIVKRKRKISGGGSVPMETEGPTSMAKAKRQRLVSHRCVRLIRLALIIIYTYCQAEDMRKIAVPAHRYTPLKENWMKIFTPIVQHLNLQIRFNLKSRNVEIRVRLVCSTFI